jgi:hypothetical protein
MSFHNLKDFLNIRTYPVIIAFLIFVFLIYTFRFLSHPALPHDMVSGWWGWWDHRQYIKSAGALSRIDLSPAEHWYFPGYAILGAVFYKSMPLHAFYFVNAICFLVTALCFIRISRHFGIGAVAASAVFLFSTALNGVVAEQFVIPWSTTPSCAIIYVILTLFLNRSTNALKFFLTGLLASAVLIIRPTDVISTAPVFLFLAANAAVGLLRRPRERIGNHPGDPAKSVPPVTLACLIAGGLAGLSCVLLVYYAIYGWSVSRYLEISQDIGFIFSALPIKLYVLFIDPAAVYGQGTAILTAYPWIFLSLIGIVCCLLERSRQSIVAACVLVHILFYACYADLLPTNIWRFNLIHYLKWTFPFLGLFAWLAVKTVLSGHRTKSAVLAAAGLICLLSVRIDLERVDAAAGTISPSGFQSSFADMASIAAIDIPMMGGLPKGLNEWPATLDADGQGLRRYAEFLSAPQDFGLRIILTRSVHAETIAAAFDPASAMSPTGKLPIGRRYGIGFGWPCWLPPYVCTAPDGGWASELDDGERIDFRKGGNSTRYAMEGWSGQEEWGTWTDGSTASLQLPVATAAVASGRDLELTIDANAFGNPEHPRQSARMIVNDEDMGGFSWEVADGTQSVAVKIPRRVALKQNPVTLVLDLTDAISPEALGFSHDPRKLGLGIRGITLKTVPAP